jgi:gas vesicle protein
MANGPTGLGGPVTAAVTGFDTGLRTARPDIPQMSGEERREYIQLIAGLRENIEQLKMESLESFAQIASIESKVRGEIINGFMAARAEGDKSRATVLASMQGELSTLIKSLTDPEPELRDKLVQSQQDLSNNIANNILADPAIQQDVAAGTITEQQLIDFTLEKLNTAAAGTSGREELAQFRITLDNTLPDAAGPAERGAMIQTATNTAEAGILSGLDAVAQQYGLNSTVLKDAFLNKQQDFQQSIGIPKQTGAELMAQKETSEAKLARIQQMRNDLDNFGVGVGSLDYFLDKANTGKIGELVAGGPTKLFNNLGDDVIAPESARFIKMLEGELIADKNRLDRFQRSMASYNQIDGVVEARRALGLQDNYQFGFYVTNNPEGFNNAVLAVRNSNAENQDQANQAIAQMLAEGDEVLAEKLAQKPNRMKRILRRQGRPQVQRSGIKEVFQSRGETPEEAKATKAPAAEQEQEAAPGLSLKPIEFTKQQIDSAVQEIIKKFPNLNTEQVNRDLTKINELSKVAVGDDAEAASKAQREIAMRLGGSTSLGPSKAGEYASFALEALGAGAASQNVMSMNQNLRQVRSGRIISAFDSMDPEFTPEAIEKSVMKEVEPLGQQIQTIAQNVQTELSGLPPSPPKTFSRRDERAFKRGGGRIQRLLEVEPTGSTTGETPSAAGAAPPPKLDRTKLVGGSTEITPFDENELTNEIFASLAAKGNTDPSIPQLVREARNQGTSLTFKQAKDLRAKNKASSENKVGSVATSNF